MPRHLRIFVSSPTDVPDERLRADLIVDKLSQDYGRFFAIESYRWEHEAMLATKHFQDAIEPPSAFDIVVLILWSRLGTPLPEKTAEREYRGIDGRAPVTGTEWEYEEALKAAREKGAPDLLAFRNISAAPIDPRDPEARARSNAQLDALDEFWRRHFADRGVFLAGYEEYRTLEQFAKRLEEFLRKLIERRIKALAAAESSAPIWLGEPFRGLESYEFEHAAIFFGRDAAITKATEQLAANARSGSAFLLVSGASGSGKSSLVKAGIVPRLMKPQRISGMAFLRRAVFRPGSEGTDIFRGLANALTRADRQDIGLPELIAFGQDPGQLATHLRSAVGAPGYVFSNTLGNLTQAGRRSGGLLAFEEAKLILVVDQFEEVFTASGIMPEDRRLFIQLLAGLARSGTVWIIVTLRADFWHRAAEIPELLALAEGQGRIDLAAGSPAELAEMIRKPAQAAGLAFEQHPETGLALDAVLAEDAAAAPGALPLLSFTLDELYKRAKSRGEAQLMHASYEALGGLEGAIAKRADELMASLPMAARAALPRVLRALTTVSGTPEQVPVARSAPLASFGEASPARILVDAFTAARLLVAASEGGSSTVRLAHEALISRWLRARDQLAADRRDLETRTLVERQFGRWRDASGRARRLLLLRNPDLANAVDLARRWGDELGAPMRDFINRSAKQARLAGTLTAAVAALFAVVAGTAFYAEQQAMRAQQDAFAQRDSATLNFKLAEQTADSLVINIARGLRSMQGMPLDSTRTILNTAKATLEQLAASAPHNLTLQLSRSSMLDEFGDTYLALGDSAEALASFQASLAIREQISAAEPGNADWQRNLSVSYVKIGDVLGFTEGKLEDALQAYRNGLIVAQRLAESDVSNRQWEFDISVLHERIGQVLRDQGKLDDALNSQRAGLSIRQKLAVLDPTNVEWQHGLATSRNDIADVLMDQGKSADALQFYRNALVTLERLRALDRNNTKWQSDLGVVQEHIGTALMAEGKLDEAWQSYRGALVIRERLSTSDPKNTKWQMDLAMSRLNLGDVLSRQGTLQGALESYRDGLAITNRLIASDSNNADWQRAAAVLYDRIGHALMLDGKLDDARDSYSNGAFVLKRLVTYNPNNITWQRNLSVAYMNVGDALLAQSEIEDKNFRIGAIVPQATLEYALQSYRDSLAIREPLAVSNRSNAQSQRDLADTLEKLASVQLRLGYGPEALTELRKGRVLMEELLRDEPTNSDWKNRLAWFERQIADLAGRPDRMPH
jgi:tetratricopeptide (TPR) repeat protein/energy-coupling factor transporter ATP-binding protein EcfA2